MSLPLDLADPHSHSQKPRVHRVLEYLEKDAKFLEEQGVMDYSLLLVGHIHC